MKKFKKCFLIIIIFIVTILILYNFTPIFEPLKEIIVPTQYVHDNGWLKVEGAKLKNNKNQDFILKGISSHGIQWYSDILTYNNLKILKETWNINVFRIAMYTTENGYISNKENIKQKLIEIANNVIDLDMYVIIDWHTLTDNDPNIYKAEAKLFFDEISTLYKDTPNVIYEICNEPNGNSVNWNENIKPYAEEIIPIIRKNSPNSLIIVGTPSWCKELSPVAQNPLNYENILYSCHFYAGTHKQELRNEIDKALNNNLPIIVSEWGTTDASGNGSVDTEETKKWIEFLKNKNISFINWSFSYKDESSAIINKNFSTENQQTVNNYNENSSTTTNELEKNMCVNDYLTESGKLVKSLLSD